MTLERVARVKAKRRELLKDVVSSKGMWCKDEEEMMRRGRAGRWGKDC